MKLTVLFILVSIVNVFSQTMRIEGSIIDSSNNQGIKDAQTILIRLSDSVIFSHQSTNENGQFSYTNIPIDTFRFIIEHPNYEPREFYFLGTVDNSDFVLDGMVLYPRGKKMEEITIFAYKDPVYYKGDTLVYVADSFKTRPNAVVEDLLKNSLEFK